MTGGRPLSKQGKGGDIMTVFEAIYLMIFFSTFVMTLISLIIELINRK